MHVCNPMRSAPARARSLARRPSDLRGRRVAVLDNSKPNADTLLGRVAELLVERHGAESVSRFRKPGASRPATIVDEIVRAADVVLTGSAD
jgi:hypothetical protein